MFLARNLQRLQKGGSCNASIIQQKATKILGVISTPETILKSGETRPGGPNMTARLFSAPAAAYNQTVDAFPSIVIGANGNLSAQGPFAESQAQVRENLDE